MAEHVEWGAVPTSGSSGDKAGYLRFESGKKYRIRPVFDPVKFYKYFHKKDGKLRTAICENPDICPVRDKYSELKKPSLRFAAYVIDRADEKVKVLEAPQSVFRPIGASFEATGNNPGSGADGSDWQVTVSGKGLATTYDVAFAGQSPLTKEEREAIKEALDGDKDKLKKLYKNNTPEEIEERLFGEINKEKSSVAETVSVDSKSKDVSNEDFDSNW